MFRIESRSHDPQENLELEESLCALGRNVFMLWRNKPSVIVGRFVNIDEEVNSDFALSHGIPIVRRKSGGGSVYHDLGNVNYTFIMRDSRTLTLEHFSRKMICVLSSLGLNAELTFRHNDILADGLKVSGAAQYRHNGVLLHHGTLLFEAELEVIPQVLRRSGRVANIRPLLQNDMNIHEFMRRIFESDYVQE